MTYKPGHVTFLLPAKNEEAAIEATLRRLPHATLAAAGFTSSVVVLDGNSLDATAELAARSGAQVFADAGLGKATAIRTARDRLKGDYVVMMDADGTYAADAVPRLLAPLAWGDADVAIGRRRPVAHSMSASHWVGNRLLSLAASGLYGKRCPDLCTGLWAFRAEALHRIPIRSRRFGLEAELFAHASRLGLRVVHVNADYLPRQGRAHLRFGPDGARIALRLVRSRFSALALPTPAQPLPQPTPLAPLAPPAPPAAAPPALTPSPLEVPAGP